MASIQERLQMKRVPLDKWSTKEKLCLTSAVAFSGDQNWMSVSRTLKLVCGANRPSDWFSQKSCAAQYGKLLEKVETPKRKKRTTSERDGVAVVETPGELILRKLTQDRIIELKKVIQEDSQRYTKVKEDIILIQSGVTDEKKLREMWKQIEQEKAQHDKDQILRAQWLKEREEKKQELERQWRPLYPGSPTSTKAQTPPLKIKDDQDEDSQSSTKSGPSPLLTSLLKSPNAGPAVTVAVTATTKTPSSPTITQLLTGGSFQVKSTVAPSQQSTAPIKEVSTDAITPAVRNVTTPAPAIVPVAVPVEKPVETTQPSQSSTPFGAAPPKSDMDAADMDSEDNVDPAKDLMDVFPELMPDELDEFLDENNAMILEDFDVGSMIEGAEEALDKDKVLELMDTDEPLPSMIEEKSTVPASKNVELSPDVTQGALANAAIAAQGNSGECSKVPEETVGAAAKAAPADIPRKADSVPTTMVEKKDDNTSEELKEEPKDEIIPIEDSTSNSPVTNVSSEENKDADPDETNEQDASDNIILVSDSSPKDDFDDSPNIVEATIDEDSDDKPLMRSDTSESTQTDSKENDEDLKAVDMRADIDKVEFVEMIEIKAEKSESKSEIDELPVDVDKAKKEALEKLASEYDFKDDEEPIVPLSIQKSKEEKHVSEDEIFEDAQETLDETEPIKEKEPSVLKKPLPEDSALAVTDTDDDSLPEMKMGKAKRDYSRRRYTDEVQKLKEDCPFSSKNDETEGRSLRKLRDRDRSESPFVMLEDDANDKMKRSYSSTPVMDSIPNSPASSEDRDYRAWKKAALAVYAKIATLKHAAPFLKPLPDDAVLGQLLRPMDLSLVKRNLENGTIRTTSELQRDLLLICSNAMLLNRVEYYSTGAARQLQRDILVLIETNMDVNAKPPKERDPDPRNVNKRSSRKSAARNSLAGGRN